MPHVNDEAPKVNAPVPQSPESVVVAVSPLARPEFVPHANPLTVAFPDPTLVMFPLRVADTSVMEDAALVVTEGAAAVAATSISTAVIAQSVPTLVQLIVTEVSAPASVLAATAGSGPVAVFRCCSV